MKALIASTLLFSQTALAVSVQPCVPLRNMSDEFAQMSGSPLPAFAQYFYVGGHRNNLDPRVLAAGALTASRGGIDGCSPLFHDPFSHIICHYYSSWSQAIEQKSDYVGTNYISQGQDNIIQIAQHEGWDDNPPNLRNIIYFYFQDMFGVIDLPVTYSKMCCGDCNQDALVSIDEIIYTISMAGLDGPPISSCPIADTDHNGVVFITDIIRVVNTALSGCPGL